MADELDKALDEAIQHLEAQPEPEVEQPQWEAYTWNGFEGQRCTICQWDTLDGPAAVEARVNGCPICRPPIVEPPIALIPVADRWGNVVK